MVGKLKIDKTNSRLEGLSEQIAYDFNSDTSDNKSVTERIEVSDSPEWVEFDDTHNYFIEDDKNVEANNLPPKTTTTTPEKEFKVNQEEKTTCTT